MENKRNTAKEKKKENKHYPYHHGGSKQTRTNEKPKTNK